MCTSTYICRMTRATRCDQSSPFSFSRCHDVSTFLRHTAQKNKNKKEGWVGLLMEIVQSMQSHLFFFFDFVCDVILFENEVYILINSVRRFDDTMDAVHSSSLEGCLVSTNMIDNI